ncbi:MAG TPA: prepilin-type N-terminal cleavage/methylation domain-containing protein [Acidimicrobiales bacterium]|nr:prepilin-type N-terminal cleavage/methylation domain-containing protein [Acidimicrobiales bacterium]
MDRRSDAGFTLIELLIAGAISVVIVGVIGTAFLVGLTTADSTTSRLAESHDAQLLASYLPSDLLSVGPSGVDTASGTITGCNDTAHLAEANVLRLQWLQTIAGTTTNSSASYRTAYDGSEWRLVRYFCTGTVLASVAPSVVTVAHNLQAPLAGPTPACPVHFALAGCATVAGSSPDTTALTLTDVSGFSYTVSGSRRTPVTSSTTSSSTPSSTTTSTSSTTTTTAPPPVTLTTLAMTDTNANGKVDHVNAVFSAALGASCNTGWSVTGGPSGATLSSAAVSGTSATLTLTEGGGAASTAVGSFRVSFAPAGGCTATGFASTAPADAAPPVVMAVSATDEDGKLEQGDTLVITFSEPVTGVPSSVTITETDPPSGNDTLAIPGITSAALDMGTGGYVTKNKDSFTFPGVAGVSGSQVTVTVGGPCTGDCASAGAGGPALFVLDPAATLVDGAGNAAVKLNTNPAPGAGFRIF